MDETAVLQRISEQGNKPEHWLEFLTQVRQTTFRDSVYYYSHLLSLYKRAADEISPDENETSIAYARILVDLAKLQA